MAESYEETRFHFLSGTGNSYRTAAWFDEMAVSRGSRSRLLPMDRSAVDVAGCAAEGFLLGLVFPTHGFTAPWHVLRFTLALPAGRGGHAAVVATRAGLKVGSLFTRGLEGTAVWLVALLLLLKGYRVRGTLGLDMPSNWTALHPGLNRSTAEAIIARGKDKAQRFMDRVLEGRTAFTGGLSLLLGLLLFPVSLGYLVYGRFWFSKFFFATSRCTGCSVCARSCPVGAIRMVGRKQSRPYWTFRCENCMRCMNFCSERAVEPSHSLGAILVLATSLPVPAMLADSLGLPDLLPKAGLWPASWVLGYAYFLGSLALTYAVISALLRVSAVNTLFAWTTTTRWYRRYREPDTDLGDLRGRNP